MNWFATTVGRMHVLERVRPRADSCKHFHRRPTPNRRHPAPQGAKLRKRGCLTSLLPTLPPKTSGSLIDSDGRVDGQTSSGIYDSVTALERRDPAPRRLVPP